MTDENRRVFISYAHESAAHVEAVRQLWTLLRESGVDAQLDLPATTQRQDWVLWMLGQLREAGYVLVVASAAYQRRGDGEAGPAEGRGVQFEAAMLRDLYYQDRPAWQKRVLPVILPGESEAGLPRWLGPFTGTTYRVEALTAAGIVDLVRTITEQGEYVEPPLGTVPALPPRGRPVTPRGEPGPDRLKELGALADAFGRIDELMSYPGRYEIISLLPPEIRGSINDAPNARLHIIAILRGCSRFREDGRQALLAILQLALPSGSPDVQEAIRLVGSARLFDE